MAFEYQGFASLGVNLNRQKYGPLDISNVFTSENDLKYYLTKGAHTEGVSKYWYESADKKVVPYPYEGQVLATVIDGVVNVFALALNEAGEFVTQEIAGKIEVDGNTIKLNAGGKLELVGMENLEAGKTYVPSLVGGVLTWAEPDTSTAEGQAQEINALKVRAEALETTVNGKAAVGEEGAEGYVPAVEGLVAKVAANTQAISSEAATRAEAVEALTEAIGAPTEGEVAASGVYAAIEAAEARAKAYADENDADTVYDDTDLQNRVAAIEGDYLKAADKYDDTDLTSRVAAIEGDYLKGEDKYDDTDLQNRVKALEDEERYDDTELSNRVTDLEVAINGNDKIDGLEARVAAMETFWDATEDSDGIVNKLKEIQEYIASDASGAAEMAGHIQTNTEAIAKLNGNEEGSVNKKITDAIAPLATTEALNGVKATAEAAATKEYTDAELAKKVDKEAYEADKATFALTADVNAALAEKADADSVVANDTFNTFKTENAQAIADAEAGAVATIEAKGYAVATEVATTYATKAELTTHAEGVANELLAYAKTADVNAELAKKIETGSIAHTTDEVAEGVTVNGTELAIVVDAFTKAETRKYVADTISQMTGGESAADVLLALNNYKSDNDERVGAIETKDGEQDAAIAAAQEQADKGVQDAAKVAADLATLTTTVGDNTREINVAKGTIDTVNTTLTNKISGLETKDTELSTAIAELEAVVSGEGGHADQIATLVTGAAELKADLEAADTELATKIQANTDKFAGYYTKTETDSAIETAINAIPAVDLGDYAKTADVNAGLAVKANAEDVYTKTEADAEFMTEAEVDSRINALIVAADPEGGKAITNIQNLVKYVDENAGEIAALLTTVNGHTTAIEKNTSDIATINTAIAAMISPKASTEITVADDGTLGIGEVSTDKLVQGSKTLVLDGGNAKAAAAE